VTSGRSPQAAALSPARFRFAGWVRPGEVYVRRPADDALFDKLVEGKRCYLVAPSQIGKTTLGLRTATRLKDDMGYAVAYIDLFTLGTGSEKNEGWFDALTRAVQKQLDAPADRPSKLTPIDYWRRYIHETLAESKKKTVLFFDEINALTTLPPKIRREFLRSLRSLDSIAGADDVLYCLLGFASPIDLADPQDAPFTTSAPIYLDDFTEADAKATFVPALSKDGRDGEALFKAIFHWTNGHPYMTQRLAEAAISRPSTEDATTLVSSLVDELFLRPSQDRDVNLVNVERKLVTRQDPDRRAPMLELLRKIQEEGALVVKEDDPDVVALYLTGAVRRDREAGASKLRLRCRILENALDAEWVAARVKDLNRPLTSALERWRENGKKAGWLIRGNELLALRKAMEGLEPTNDENEFLRACAEHEEREKARSAQIRGALFVVAALAVVLGAVWIYRLYRDNQLRIKADAERSALSAEKAKRVDECHTKIGGLDDKTPALLGYPIARECAVVIDGARNSCVDSLAAERLRAADLETSRAAVQSSNDVCTTDRDLKAKLLQRAQDDLRLSARLRDICDDRLQSSNEKLRDANALLDAQKAIANGCAQQLINASKDCTAKVDEAKRSCVPVSTGKAAAPPRPTSGGDDPYGP
jgi:hypothetical protein